MTAKTLGLLSASASETQIDNCVGGPEQARALGRGGAGEISLTPLGVVGVQNC